MKKPTQFIREVQSEARRVTWPGRRETLMTTLFVFVFALIASIYFLIVDQFVYRFIHWVIGLGH